MIAALDRGLHSFLFALSEAQESGMEVAVIVGGCNIAEQSNGSHDELFGDEGWFIRFSRHGPGLA